MTTRVLIRSQLTAAGILANQTWYEARRQRTVLIFACLALGLVAGVLVLRVFNFDGAEDRFIVVFGFGVLSLAGGLLSILASTLLFFGEIEHRVVQTVLAKPVTREAYLMGKWLGLSLLLAVFSLLVLGLLATLLGWQGHGGRVSAAFAIAGGAQILKLSVLSALTLAFAVTARTSIATGVLAVLFWICCQLHPMLVELTAVDRVLWLQMLAGAAVWVVPDFPAYDLAHVVTGEGTIGARQCLGLVLQAAGTIAAALTVAAWGFCRREL